MKYNKPLISIVTPCLNRASMLPMAIESVCKQNYDNIEHIIIDGGSTDGTLDLLKNYPHLKVISEPDQNLYDALNKGILLAKGDIIGHLNSDDYYEPDCFDGVSQIFKLHAECDSVCGGAKIFEIDINGNQSIRKKFVKDKFKHLSLPLITYGMPIINARFFRKDAYNKLGLYDIQFPIAADREFLLRAYMSSLKTYFLDKIVYNYRFHSGSLTINENKKKDEGFNLEYFKIIQKYINKPGVPLEIYNACHNWHIWMLGYAMIQCVKKSELKRARDLLKMAKNVDKFFLFRYILQRIQYLLD